MGEVISIAKQADGKYKIYVPGKDGLPATNLILSKEEMGELIEALDKVADEELGVQNDQL